MTRHSFVWVRKSAVLSAPLADWKDRLRLQDARDESQIKSLCNALVGRPVTYGWEVARIGWLAGRSCERRSVKTRARGGETMYSFDPPRPDRSDGRTGRWASPDGDADSALLGGKKAISG